MAGDYGWMPGAERVPTSARGGYGVPDDTMHADANPLMVYWLSDEDDPTP